MAHYEALTDMPQPLIGPEDKEEVEATIRATNWGRSRHHNDLTDLL